ncbi:hypothetical protein J6590_092045 [Homalodisca vitripennis]|nr:hypothetical protein J6590_092045 [Homalodisca vitripennis]
MSPKKQKFNVNWTVVTPRIASWLSEKKCTLHVCRPDYSASENESICLQTKLLSVVSEKKSICLHTYLLSLWALAVVEIVW